MDPSPRPARPARVFPPLTVYRPHVVLGDDAPPWPPRMWFGGELVYPQVVQLDQVAARPVPPAGIGRPVAGAAAHLMYELVVRRFGGIRIGVDLAPDGTPGWRHASAWLQSDVHRDLMAVKYGAPIGWDVMPHSAIAQQSLKRATWMLHGLGATVYRMMPAAWGGSCPALDAWASDFEYEDELATGIKSAFVDLRQPATY